jgi:hypothetical protein
MSLIVLGEITIFSRLARPKHPTRSQAWRGRRTRQREARNADFLQDLPRSGSRIDGAHEATQAAGAAPLVKLTG